MIGLLCIIPLFLLAGCIYARTPSINREIGSDGYLREVIIEATIIWSAGILLMSEFLSLFYGLGFTPVLLLWLMINLLLGLKLRQSLPVIVRNLPRIKGKPDVVGWIALGVIAILILATAAMAIFTSPNNPDSLSYHLVRQLHWMQQGSLNHYFTENDRQLMMPPLSEIIGLQFMILTGSDSWVHFPQWMAYLLGALTASLLARDLGGKSRGQLLSVLFFMTIPLAFHQASNAKNDLLTGLYFLSLVRFVLQLDDRSNSNPRTWILIGINLGLLWTIKGTGLLYSVPVMLVAAGFFYRHHGWKTWKPVALITLLTCLLSVGHYSRNMAWYGSPFGESEKPGYDLRIQQITAGSIISNAVRNSAMHLALPSETYNGFVEKSVQTGLGWLGQDANDRKTTFWDEDFVVRYFPREETRAPAPVHILFIFCLPLLIYFNRKRSPLSHYLLIGMFAGGFFLFCLTLQWQPWHARLQLPLFCLAAPILGVLVCQLFPKKGFSLLSISILFLALAPSFNSTSRPLIGEKNIFNYNSIDSYYRHFEHLKFPQLSLYQILMDANPRSIRFYLSWDYAYPIMRMLIDTAPVTPHFWGRVKPEPSPDPEAIIVRADGFSELYTRYPGVEEWYQAVGSVEPYIVYLKGSLVREKGLANILPRFVGWRYEKGLEQVNVMPLLSKKPPFRKSLGSKTRLEFGLLSEEMRIKGILYLKKTTQPDTPKNCEMWLNDNLIRTFKGEDGRAAILIDETIKPKTAGNVLEFHWSPGTSGVFTKLQITEMVRP